MQYAWMAVGAEAEELGGGAAWDTLAEAREDARRSWAGLRVELPDLERLDLWTLEGYDRADLLDSYVGPAS